MELSRRDFFKGAALTAAGTAGALAGLGLVTNESRAFADPVVVGSGSIGINFGQSTSVLAGQSITGTVFSYDIGGTDSLHLGFEYDTQLFSNVTATAQPGVTIYGQTNSGGSLNLVAAVDPATADYANLFAITVTAATTTGAGNFKFVFAKAAKQGGTVTLSIVSPDNSIIVQPDTPIGDFSIEVLSAAMGFYLVETGEPRWPEAAQYDITQDGKIDIDDFIAIANGILDATGNIKLQFRADGSFKILQISDYQDYINSSNRPNVHSRTVALLNAMLDAEQPDLVVMTGDQIGNLGAMDAALVADYIHQMVLPVEEHKIPWFMTFGNHDDDGTSYDKADVGKIFQLAEYRKHHYNINRATMSGCTEWRQDSGATRIDCVGDMYCLIYDIDGMTPIYNLWGIDSNSYQEEIRYTRPVPYGPYMADGSWDWVRPGQVQWYSSASEQLEQRYGRKLNSLMFFHIPLQEWSNMTSEWDKFQVKGVRNEGECPGMLNSGLYGAVLSRGDVRGMFVGHEHVNDYIGDYYGIKLAYDASIGYTTYGGEQKGGRVIELNKSDLSKFSTRMIYAEDYGLHTGTGNWIGARP